MTASSECCPKGISQAGPLFLFSLKCYNAHMDIKDTILIVSLLNLIIGVFVLARNTRSKLNRSFFSIALTLSVWSASMYFYVRPIIYDSELWIKIVYFFVLCLILAWTYFFKLFLEVKEKLFPTIFLLFTPVFIYILFGTDYWVKEVVDKSWGPETILGPAYLYFGIYTGLAVIWITYFWIKKFLKSEGITRMQLLYVFISMIVYSVLAILFDVVLPLATGNSKFFWVSTYFSLFFVGASAYAIFRYRLMDIRIVARQSFVYSSSFATVVGLVFGFHYILARFWHLSHSIEILIIAVISAGLFHPLTNLYLKIANKYFFYSVYSYQETIKSLSNELTTILDLNGLTQKIVQELINVMKLNRVGVLLREESSGRYHIQNVTGFRVDNGISLVKDNFLTQRLETTQKPVIYEELGLQIRDARDEKIKQRLVNLQSNMKRIEAELCLPLISKDKLRGIIVLGKKLSGEAYSVQDLDLLETLSSQASLAIENAQLYAQVQDFSKNLESRVSEQTKEIREKSNRLEELLKKNEALSQMKTEFLRVVNHQLRTPTSIIKGMLSMLVEGSIEGKAKREEAIDKIYSSADRLETILDDILDAQDLVDGKPSPDLEPTNLGELVNKVISPILILAKQKKIKLEFKKPAKPLPKILLDAGLIKKALKKIVDNAVLYTEKGGVVVNTEIIRDQQTQKDLIRITVKDSGVGIIEADKSKLFKIFTRGTEAERIHQNGSGLGLYIAKEYIEAHQGKIEAESEGKGKGTTFIITLPIVTEV